MPRLRAAAGQADLFAPEPPRPEGLAYARDLVPPEEEAALASYIAQLELKPFEFRGYLGHRRVTSFGWRYDFNDQAMRRAGEIPDFLLPLRERAAALAGLEPADLTHVLVTEYAPGAGIGWHRDRPQFAEVVGVSLLSACTLRFRRRLQDGFERAALLAEPRSGYVLRGPARTEWEHSIAAVEALRYSVTFRRLSDLGRRTAGETSALPP
jgi:alkylated DNA repair dioxygenase AlkB